MIHASQLFPGEEIQKATLDDGRVVEVLSRKGQSVYAAPGRPGNFCQVGDLPPMADQHFFFTRLTDGSSVQIKLNAISGSLCISVMGEGRGVYGREFSVDLRGPGRPFVTQPLDVKP